MQNEPPISKNINRTLQYISEWRRYSVKIEVELNNASYKKTTNKIGRTKYLRKIVKISSFRAVVEKQYEPLEMEQQTG